MPQSIDSILDAAEQHQASDVFLQEGEVPRLKINEQILLLGEEPLSLAQMSALWQACGANAQGDMDRDSGLISHTHTRYRVNLHRTMGRLGAVLRRIKTTVPALNTLGVPDWLLTRWAAARIRPHSRHRPDRLREVHHHRRAAAVDEREPGAPRGHHRGSGGVSVSPADHCHFTQREVGRDTSSFCHRPARRHAPGAGRDLRG